MVRNRDGYYYGYRDIAEALNLSYELVRTMRVQGMPGDLVAPRLYKFDLAECAEWIMKNKPWGNEWIKKLAAGDRTRMRARKKIRVNADGTEVSNC